MKTSRPVFTFCTPGRSSVVLLMGLAISISFPKPAGAQYLDPGDADHLNSGHLLTALADLKADEKSQGEFFGLIESIRNGDHGVTVAPVYVGEVFTNTRGGLSTRNATQYQALLDLPIAFEFERMGLPVPGRFFLLGQNTHGRGLTNDFVGDTLVVSNIDSFANITQVSEYWSELNLFDDQLIFRLGKQDINTEFLFIETAEHFVHSTFGLSPSSAFPTYPDQSMAAVILVRPNEAWCLKVGVWDAFSSGRNWGFSGNDSVVVIGEMEYAYALANGSLPGKVAIGAAYESAGVLPGSGPVSAVREYYAQFEQLLYRERHGDEESPQGLAIFAGYYPRFPGPLVTDESIGDSFVAGFVYTGLIPGRDEDILGAGVAWAKLYQGGTNQETVFEVSYLAQLNPRTTVQPVMQYIVTPSGIYDDSLVTGLRFGVTW